MLEARGGSEALAVLQDAGSRLDLLISDVVMPEMRGPELASRLRREQPDLLVLFVSGYSDRQVGLDDAHSPRTRFLTKPISAEALTTGVRELLQDNAG